MCYIGLKTNEAIEILKWAKNNGRYRNGIKLLQHVMEKALPIAEALYLRYSILFIFDNTTRHSVYTEDALCTYTMNKRPSDKQVILCNGWYIDQMSMYHIQPMWYLGSKREQIPKEIPKFLIEKRLWPATELNLEYSKPKCYNCHMIADSKRCIKYTWCQTCWEKKDHRGSFGSGQKYDAYVAQKRNCQCVSK